MFIKYLITQDQTDIKCQSLCFLTLGNDPMSSDTSQIFSVFFKFIFKEFCTCINEIYLCSYSPLNLLTFPLIHASSPASVMPSSFSFLTQRGCPCCRNGSALMHYGRQSHYIDMLYAFTIGERSQGQHLHVCREFSSFTTSNTSVRILDFFSAFDDHLENISVKHQESFNLFLVFLPHSTNTQLLSVSHVVNLI